MNPPSASYTGLRSTGEVYMHVVLTNFYLLRYTDPALLLKEEEQTCAEAIGQPKAGNRSRMSVTDI